MYYEILICDKVEKIIYGRYDNLLNALDVYCRLNIMIQNYFARINSISKCPEITIKEVN